MATPIDLLDPPDQPAVMSYGGLVDASTVEGQADEAADYAGVILTLQAAVRRPALPAADRQPARHLAHITRRRGTYPQAR